jgi:hypothetical protein
MKTYGKVTMSTDIDTGMEVCTFRGDSTGWNWTYVGYGADWGLGGPDMLSPIGETYLSLWAVMWSEVDR